MLDSILSDHSKREAFYHAAAVLSPKLNIDAGTHEGEQLLKEALADVHYVSIEQAVKRQLGGELFAYPQHILNTIPGMKKVVTALRKADPFGVVLFRDLPAGHVYGNRKHPLRDNFYPPVLYTMGDKELLQRDSIAVISTSNTHLHDINSEGLDVLEKVIQYLSPLAVIVSTMETGYSAFAHEFAIKHGKTIAVCKYSLDLKHEKESQNFGVAGSSLRKRIAEDGLLVSQYPFGISKARMRPNTWMRTVIGLSSQGMFPVKVNFNGTKAQAITETDRQGKTLYIIPEYARIRWAKERAQWNLSLVIPDLSSIPEGLGNAIPFKDGIPQEIIDRANAQDHERLANKVDKVTSIAEFEKHKKDRARAKR
ncbi:MAG: DNA-processing protein DprA [Candidatus Nanoarchaeia archaeon]